MDDSRSAKRGGKRGLMDALEALMTLRSIRRFTDEPVTDDEVMTCIRAAVQAPNGGNAQPWQFVVLSGPDAKRGVADLYLRAWRRYERASRAAQQGPPNEVFEKNMGAARRLAERMADVPVLVIVLMLMLPWSMRDEEGEIDIGSQYGSVFPAVQNLMLAARAQGIGTTLTTLVRVYPDELRALLQIPEQYEAIALIPMGRPKGRFGVAPRRPAERVTHWNTFGERRT